MMIIRYFLEQRWTKSFLSILVLSFSSLLASCEYDQYETGDGNYSYLRADFVEAHTIDSKKVDYAINDDGEKIVFTTPCTVKWAENKDTLYRALLYYNRKPEGAEPISIQRVHVLKPLLADTVKNTKTDPITLESTWISDCQRTFSFNGEQKARYLNVSFAVKTGQHEEELVQTIGVMRESRNDTLLLTFLHDQGGVPEYYSSHVYASIPLFSSKENGTPDNFPPVIFTINTYQGKVVKSY
jgi:hypothetical protein